MSETSEQIGDLIYVPNPSYPYPFPVAHPPHFWMTEQSGRLAAAIEDYLNGEPLSTEGIGLIQQYLHQYIGRAVMTGDANRGLLLRKIATLRNNAAIERFADLIAEVGVEPF